MKIKVSDRTRDLGPVIDTGNVYIVMELLYRDPCVSCAFPIFPNPLGAKRHIFGSLHATTWAAFTQRICHVKTI